MISAVLERNHVAVGGFSENLEDFAGKDPVVSMQDSRARFNDDACHGRGQLPMAAAGINDALRPRFDEIAVVP